MKLQTQQALLEALKRIHRWHLEYGEMYEGSELFNNTTSAIAILEEEILEASRKGPIESANKTSADDYVLVPKEQIEKVEQCRIELHEITDVIASCDWRLVASIRRVTEKLWDVSHRRYSASPSHDKPGAE